jgi:uncharacterized Ntn-hydrolase superfamily protein
MSELKSPIEILDMLEAAQSQDLAVQRLAREAMYSSNRQAESTSANSGSATAHEDHDSAGHSVTADPYVAHHAWEVRGKFRRFESALVGRIITFMAGAEAEVAVFGACGGLDTDDRVQIGLMLTELGRDAKVEERLRRATRHLVHRHLATVSTVAKMLETKVPLSTEEIDAVLPNERHC